MNIIKTAIAPVIMGTAMTLSGCDSSKYQSDAEQSRRKVLSEVLAEKPVKEYDKIIEGLNGKTIYFKESFLQSSLDSVAYRNLFEGTTLAKDSARVKEFNDIARKTRPNLNPISYEADYKRIIDALDNKVKDMGITKREYDVNANEYSKIGHYRSAGIGSTWERELDRNVAVHQFKADSLAYEKFFRRNKLLTDSVRKEIKNIAKIIKP